jgi:hypothetical protein
MQTRILRAMFLLILGVMVAAYAASLANGKPAQAAPANSHIVWQEWC